ncbi:DNA polymerase III subunit gamma/tau [Myxococcus stipitatus]|uniref:DNA polymerase III subunit gamma/tau n=1 Tax=Myxococcus stipitatus TaxID=83455 RepID=UPI001F18E5EE|nr:DNA polymerase III subunit gamma/tau [Myxococcus stipitatus]MCE9673788.1 DNA polymerase III subunit gamma/tau [Myxococcus stipitatus]
MASAPTAWEPPREGPRVAETRDASASRYDESDYVPEPPPDIELPRHDGPSTEPPLAAASRDVSPWTPPAPPGGPVMDGLPASAARPLSFLRNGGGAPQAPGGAPGGVVSGYSAERGVPSGPVMEGLPASAARPLSFLRKGPPAPPVSAPPTPAPGPHAGATSLSRTTEPAPTVRVVNVRKPEPPPGAIPEPPPVEEDESRYYPEEASPGGCASGECLPEPEAPAAEPEPEPPPLAASAPPVARSRDNPNLPLIERWRAAVETVKGNSLRHGTALANGRLLSMKAGEIILGYIPAAGLHRMTVTAAAGKSLIDKLLAEHFGRPVKLTFQDIAADDSRAGLSIAERDAQSRANYEKNTESKVRNHASVRSVLMLLGGEIEHIQVYEPERPSAASVADAPIEAPDDSA